jgi:hypothetical protein
MRPGRRRMPQTAASLSAQPARRCQCATAVKQRRQLCPLPQDGCSPVRRIISAYLHVSLHVLWRGDSTTSSLQTTRPRGKAFGSIRAGSRPRHAGQALRSSHSFLPEVHDVSVCRLPPFGLCRAFVGLGVAQTALLQRASITVLSRIVSRDSIGCKNGRGRLVKHRGWLFEQSMSAAAAAAAAVPPSSCCSLLAQHKASSMPPAPYKTIDVLHRNDFIQDLPNKLVHALL